ncbi:MAG: hypothetical protein IPP42_00070 [Saprospiraceae bacterium]|nr:hypothetical protein [Saprospiraceae bacterium]
MSIFCQPIYLTGYISVAQYIICRAGYSTLMDLAAWSKKLILVPTPGQTEQWYLARRLVDLDMAVIWDIEKKIGSMSRRG